MNLIPFPKELKLSEGIFDISKAKINAGGNSALEQLLSDLTEIPISGDGNIHLQLSEETAEESYVLMISEDEINISGSEKGIFYAVSTLRQLMAEYGEGIPCLEISDSPDLKIRGFYFDITRGRVPKLETLYRLCDKMALYKMNHLQLYVEHSFEYSGMEEIWQDKSPITRDEIRALDAYCRKLHIELVPSFALFGHLYEILRHPKFAHLSELVPIEEYSWEDRMAHHTIDVSNPESLELVKGMIDDVADLFSSDKFNICCDETFDLGKGRSKEYVDKIGTGNAYLEFVSKIAEHVKSKGKNVMLWGDVVLNHGDCLDKIPDELTMLNWNYMAEPSEENIITFKEFGIPQVICSAAWGWNRLINDYETAISNISSSALYAKRHGALGLLTTDWGDWGHINRPEYSFPMLVLSAGKAWNAGHNIKPSDISSLEGLGDNTLDILLSLENCLISDFRTATKDCINILKGSIPEEAMKYTEEDYLKALEKICEAEKKLPDHYYIGIHGTLLIHMVSLCFALKVNINGLSSELKKFIDYYSSVWLRDYKSGELDKIQKMFASFIEIIEKNQKMYSIKC